MIVECDRSGMERMADILELCNIILYRGIVMAEGDTMNIYEICILREGIDWFAELGGKSADLVKICQISLI